MTIQLTILFSTIIVQTCSKSEFITKKVNKGKISQSKLLLFKYYLISMIFEDF